MRYILLASALVAFAPVALAQTSSGSPAKPAASAPAMSSNADSAPSGYKIMPPDPNNCGTPDQPYPCNKAAAAKMAPAAKKPST